MMLLDNAVAAYAHYLSIFCALGLLVAELAVLRPDLDARGRRLLPRLDLLYLCAVIAIVVTGLLRLFFFAKGPAFYAASGMFWIKMALFLTVGLLSLPPTFAFLAARRQGRPFASGEFRRVRNFIVAELAVFAMIPLAATLMARGLAL